MEDLSKIFVSFFQWISSVQFLQLICSLSILVVLHELGHFIPAKLFKTKVERFFLFFDPKFALWSKKIGETVYGIGWLPLGGYVKIAGMIDESMDTEQLKQEPQPWEFRSKPAWQKLIIMLGGVFVNAILAILIFTGILMYWGESILPLKEAKYGISVSETAEKIGLMAGDKIVKIGDVTPQTINEAAKELVLADVGSKIVVNRDENLVEIVVTEAQKKLIFGSKDKKALIEKRVPALIGKIVSNSPAHKAGLQEGDEIVSIDMEEIAAFDQVPDYLTKNKPKEVEVTLRRNSEIITKPIALDAKGILGIYPMDDYQLEKENIFNYQNKKYTSLSEAIPAGYAKAKDILMVQLRSFKLMFNKETEAYKQAGSIFSITKAFAPVWDWHSFWSLTGMLSVVLAFFNLLPIPGLDGGHAMFALYEMIVGKPAPQKFMEIVQTIGIVFLLGLMLLSFGWDGYKAINETLGNKM
ncbi:MAG: RIP metalloprotease RseP [Flavobacteriaceae bacterium]|nr:MAG: RIP metalloprotease RseP [Flavobacteriaceae bacterium]